MSGTKLLAPWAMTTFATIMPPRLHCPIATSGSPQDNNQCSTAKSNQAVHVVAGFQTHDPLIRGNVCIQRATTNGATESLQPTHPCHNGDLTYGRLIRRNQCIQRGTTNGATESYQQTHHCRDGDLNPKPSHLRESVHTKSIK